MYSNSILTEAIAIPLYMLFLRYSFEYIEKQKRSTLCVMFTCMFVLISLRKQMYISVIIMIIAIIWAELRKHELRKVALRRMVLLVSCIVCVFLSMMLCERVFNYCIHNQFVGHTSDNRFVMTMIMYTSERDDIEQMSEENRDLFLEIYDDCENSGYLPQKNRGWLQRVTHFGDNYDLIQERIVTHVQESVINRYTDEITERNIIADQICSEIIAEMMPMCISRIAGVLFDNFLSGLVTTVAVRKPILIVYSAIVYLIYLLAVLFVVRRYGVNNGASCLALIIAISIILNVGLVAAVIFCQTRYTIYNMSLFYITLFLMGIEIKRSEERKH